MDWHPLRFHPLPMERVWGGRRLETLYHRPLPAGRPIGESWEITDRPEAVSIVAAGPLAGRSLSQLMADDPQGLLGDAAAPSGRFPILVKILDARQTLSLQVHPPASQAARLGGEPKTELWYVTEADPEAILLAGLRRGTTRTRFEEALRLGTVADAVHRLPVRTHDALFLPSGRIHALGAGLVLYEIQENSDTTYRVFDWNRVGLDGKPRPLHVPESLASIDFDDVEPGLLPAVWHADGPSLRRPLVSAPPFMVEARRAQAGVEFQSSLLRCWIVGVIAGTLEIRHGSGSAPARLVPGDFCLLPAGAGTAHFRVIEEAHWLVAQPGPRNGTAGTPPNSPTPTAPSP